MSQSASPTASAADLGLARRWLMEAGEVPSGLVDESLSRSWERSRHAGLSPVDGLIEPPLCGDGELRQALSAEHDFLAQARPVMDFVFGQMRDSGSLVVLSDARGLLLHSLGDADFLSRAELVSLRPGALWHEADRGTNAIGTALAENAEPSTATPAGGTKFKPAHWSYLLTWSGGPFSAALGYETFLLTHDGSLPKWLPAGTTLRVRGAFDNSPQNPFNPNPNVVVRGGEEVAVVDRIGHSLSCGTYALIAPSASSRAVAP